MTKLIALTSSKLTSPAFSPVVGGILHRKCACGQHTTAGGKCEECKKKSELTLQRPSAGGAEPATVPPIVHEVLRSPGQPLDPVMRAFFEPRFQHDFSDLLVKSANAEATRHTLTMAPQDDSLEQEADQIAERAMRASDTSASSDAEENNPKWLSQVRVHVDSKAAESARALSAAAYTFGTDIVFGASQYSPTTTKGRELLAHELGHALRHGQRYRRTATAKVMRKIDLPSEKELQTDVAQLRLRLEKLLEEEAAKGQAIPEVAQLREQLGWRESLVGETDEIRKRITFYRGRLRELRNELASTPPSSRREEIGRDIGEHEKALAKALRSNIRRLDVGISKLRNQFTPSDPAAAEIGQKIVITETELTDNEAELKILERVFHPAKAAAVGEKYKKEVKPLPGGGCMTAVYKGLEALYTPTVSAETKKKVQSDARRILKETGRDTNNIDRIMETLRANSLTGGKTLFKYNLRHKAWVPDIEKTLLDMLSPVFLGWYFFGLSVSGGYHSVILAVDNSEGSAPQIFWMDQYAKGFTKNVTGKLEAAMKEDWLLPPYGFADSTIWPLIPKPEAVVEVP